MENVLDSNQWVTGIMKNEAFVQEIWNCLVARTDFLFANNLLQAVYRQPWSACVDHTMTVGTEQR